MSMNIDTDKDKLLLLKVEECIKREKDNAKTLRNIEIYLKHKEGISTKELAIFYSISTRTITRIIKGFKKSDIKLIK